MTEQAAGRLINGRYVNIENAIAFCHASIHPGYLSKTLVKSHDCLAKQCPFFERLKPEYWETLEKAKQKIKNNRSNKKQAVKKAGDRDAFIRKTLEDSGHIYVTSIKEESSVFFISYIFDEKVDLTPEIQILRVKLKKSVKLSARTGSGTAIEQLIRRRRRESGKVTDLKKAPKVGAVAENRLMALGVYCLEDLFGRSGDELFKLDCELSGGAVNRRYLTAYRSAVAFAAALCTRKKG